MSRDSILARIREANRVNAPGASDSTRLVEWNAIPRSYRRAGQSTPEELRKLFADRLRHYEGETFEPPTSIADILTMRGKQRLIVPRGLPEELLPREGFTFIRDDGLSKQRLDDSDGVITTCTLAIALTGTIILESAPGQGRRAATLVPDYHLCLLPADRIVEFVPEAIANLQQIKHKPLTFFSGPSATVDIEMTKVRGVHGPRRLDVLIY